MTRWGKTRKGAIAAVLVAACVACACLGCAFAPSGSHAPESATASASAAAQPGSSSTASHVAGKDRGGAALAEFEEDPAFDAMKSQVEELVAASGIDVGVAFVDLSDDSRVAGFSVHGDMSLVAASMIKLLVLAEFLDEVDAGKLSMDEPYALQAEDIVGGTGSVQSAGVGTTFTLGELARLMICESDNVAANILINRMGMDAVNAQAEKLGLENTQLNRLMMSAEAQAKHIENTMSAKDAATLLTMVWRGQLVSEEASAFALEALDAQFDGAGIGQALPEGVAFAHKTGTLDLVKNDGGIVKADKPYVLTVFCSGGDASASLDLMVQISRIVYEQFE